METDKNHLFDNPKNIKWFLYILYGSCAALFILDFVVHRHIRLSWGNLWGFYPIYGFVGCIVLVHVAKWARTFLMRPEDYYASEGKGNQSVAELEAPLCVEEKSVEEKRSTKAGDHNVDG